MHPFVHSFNPAIAPPWETRTDFDVFHTIAREFSRLAATHLGVRRDVDRRAAGARHPRRAGPAGRPGGDWKAGECEPVPGQTMPKLVVVERDYAAVAEKMAAVGPLLDTLGTSDQGHHVAAERGGGVAAPQQRRRPRRRRRGPPPARPDRHFCEAILALSGTTNGRLAVQGWRRSKQRTGVRLADLAEERAGDRITFADTQNQPHAVITSPEWSGTESGGRRYSPFTVNVERKKPWHTLTGRQHFYLDHDWIARVRRGAARLPAAAGHGRHFGDQGRHDPAGRRSRVRYLTPHSKWSIHSEYQENLHMLTLFRGGPVIWMHPADAEAIGVSDNDWIEAFNRNGVVACPRRRQPPHPAGNRASCTTPSTGT